MLIFALTCLLAAPPSSPVSSETPWFVSLRPAIVVQEPEPVADLSEGTVVEEMTAATAKAAVKPPVVLAPAKAVKAKPNKIVKRIPKRSPR